MSSQMNRFQLLKNIHIIEQGLSEEFIKILEKCKNPHIICFYGNEKVDKKIKIINQIINGNTNQYHLTNNQSNCCFYGPIKIKDIIKNNDLNINNIQININDDIIFIDSYDLKNIENFGNTYITEILTILQISSLNILYINYNNINDFDSEISNMKLINILNPNENKKIIILFGDVLLTELNQRQILGELKQYKKIFQEKINPFMNKEGNIGGICEILP